MISTAAPAFKGYRIGFESLDREVRLDTLPVDGSLPAWLSGTLLRNGPARFEVGRERFRHWFDGLAMLHRFTIGGGNVSYANRFLRSKRFTAAERTGRIAGNEFATRPRRSFLDRLCSPLGSGVTDNANVNIVPFRDGYLALTETPGPLAFDGATLATRGTLSYDDRITAPVMTAHPHHDRVRGATFNVIIEMGRTTRYSVVRIPDGTLRRTIIASVSVAEPAYLHAFSTTARYVIIAEYPLVVRALDLLLMRKPFIENYRWKPERATRFHVIDKDTGVLGGVYEAEAFFAFHHINAYDDGDSVVLDICAYADASILGEFMLAELRARKPISQRTLRRFRLMPGRSAAEAEIVSDVSVEMPRVAPAKLASQYRFAYAVGGAPASAEIFERIVKVDLTARTSLAWSAPGAYAAEPVFVARPRGIDEDDGVLLSVVLDAATQTSFLLVLDARTLEEHARAHVPHHIPFGFHGMFCEAGAL